VLKRLSSDDVAENVNASIGDERRPTFLEADDRRQTLVSVGDDQKVFFVQLVISVVDDVQQDRKIEQNLKERLFILVLLQSFEIKYNN
jgi:DNA polymerase IIIc chi subunit